MAASASTPSLLDAVRDVPRVSEQAWRRMGWLRRGLIASRAAVLPLTVFSSLFGGLLGLPLTPEEGGRLALVTLTLVLAHATSNLQNDLVDWWVGLDRDGYFRLRYGAHPLAQGFITPLTHGALLLVTGGITLWLALAICREAGAPAYWLAAAGAALMLLYTWPLKRLGLGEVAVFLVWGPLMVGGTYWVVTGDWGPEIGVLSALFGLGPTVVVFAKHVDKRRDDAARGVATLPVRLGAAWAPRVAAGLAVAQMAAGVAWAWYMASWFYLLLLAALPALWSFLGVCLRRRPRIRPRGYPTHLWPLWYAVAGFRYARSAGAALAAAVLLQGMW